MLHALIAGLLVAQATPSPSPSAAPSAAPSTASLTLSTNAVNLNPAQQRVVGVTGATPPLTATLDRKLVGISVDPAGASVTIQANQATGSDVLHVVDAAGAAADVAIRVAFNAGTIVPQTTLQVTGNPVEPNWLAREVAAWVARLTQTLPGAQAVIGSVEAPAAPLFPGGEMQFTIPVQISSDGRYFDQTGSTTVSVRNVAAEAIAPALLFYDDDPEHVSADGVLFRGTVTAAEPATLYYYHDNAGDPRRIVVVLSTESADPTSVQMVDASAGPNIDVMQVGHTVTREFLLRKPRGEGTVVDLMQDVPFALHDVPMTARQGVAGNIDLRVLSGGPVTVTVVAASPGVDVRSLLGQPPLPDDGHHRTGVFRLAGFGSGSLSYATGGADARLVIGDREPTLPSADPNSAGHDYGDYGVTQTVDVSLSNPGAVPATAYLYFRPIGGIARASFLVDGSLTELGCAREPVPYQIAAFALSPGQSSRAVVQTMADGGSFYPIEIGITATPPAPATPPINAPDGCFPKP
ncbi:MAG: hypothetical protein WB615_12540 [Candidatus Tumulicola sp.]